MIGERLTYELLVSLPAPGYAINFKLPDSIPHFDILENKNFDTINNTGFFQIHKQITFTSFDSGAWHIPAFDVLVEGNNTSQKFLTDSILVNVGYSPADSTNQLRDIKPIMEVDIKDYFWYYVAGVILIALVIAFFVYRYFKNRPTKEKPIFNSAITPYDEAMNGLKELEQTDLKDSVQIKAYHTSMAAIFKKYYSRKKDKNMINKTTSDILLAVKEQYEDASLVSTLAESLRVADAVKFAKYIPAVSESTNSHSQVKKTIDFIEKIQSQPNQ